MASEFGIDPISNEALTLDQVPPDDASWPVIAEFALTFDGYEYWEGFERCAEIANNHQHGTLTELRTCLFFEQRRWRHFGTDPDDEAMLYIRSLLGKIRDMVLSG